MSNLINQNEVHKLIAEVLEQDMNNTLEAVTNEVINKLKDTVKRNVAARMIALASSEYSLEYRSSELRIKVKLETN